MHARSFRMMAFFEKRDKIYILYSRSLELLLTIVCIVEKFYKETFSILLVYRVNYFSRWEMIDLCYHLLENMYKFPYTYTAPI